MLKKFFKETSSLSWTLGGTALVLITLSGATRAIGLWISAISLIAHFLGVLFSEDTEDEVK